LIIQEIDYLGNGLFRKLSSFRKLKFGKLKFGKSNLGFLCVIIGVPRGAEGAAAPPPGEQIFPGKKVQFSKKFGIFGQKNGILPPPENFFSFCTPLKSVLGTSLYAILARSRFM